MGRKRTDLAPRIVAAARERFLLEGVDGASLRAIAADAGTSIGMVYYYFRTKDELFFAVVEATYSKVLADLTEACAADVAPKERLRRLYRRIGAIDELEGKTLRLVIREVLVSSRRLDTLVARFQRGHLPLVLTAIRDGMLDGSIRDDRSPWIALFATFAVGAGPQFAAAAVGERLGLGLPRGDALADLLVELLWTGIGRTDAPEFAVARKK
ncbi:MAG: TetR/AcrR family transcriptional regulator [Kofleriaceae bacterium]